MHIGLGGRKKENIFYICRPLGRYAGTSAGGIVPADSFPASDDRKPLKEGYGEGCNF